MPDPTPRLDSLGPLADQGRLSSPRMMSGQFPDEILDPAIREMEQKFGYVVDRDALRERLEQEIGFADYGKYFTGLFLDFARQLEQKGLRVSTEHGIFAPADIRAFVRRRFPEPGPQSGLLQAPRGSLAATLPTDAASGPSLRPLPPALSARVHALLSSQSDPTSPSTTA